MPEPEPEPEPAREPGVARELVLNEIAAHGEPHDWFEIVNASTSPLDLSGYVFVDRPNDFLRAKRFPDITLAPGARHVQDVTRADAGFALGKSDGLYVYTFEDRRLVDGVRWRGGASPPGGSVARTPDVTGAFVTAKPATRGAAN